jgi:hypothetical protein
VVWGPALQRRAARRRDAGTNDGRLSALTRPRLMTVLVGVYVLGIYGGYFGAAQGVLIIGLLSVLTWSVSRKGSVNLWVAWPPS